MKKIYVGFGTLGTGVTTALLGTTAELKDKFRICVIISAIS